MDHVRIAAPHTFRRFALQIALGLALAESGLFFFVWRLGVLVEPAAGRKPALAFIVLGSVLTLQAMVVVGIAWAVVAISRTTVDADEIGLTLEHPWRRWHGDWWAVRHAWRRGDWLTFELSGQWRRWYVRVAADDDGSVARLRRHLPDGAWLEGSALGAYYLSSVLPVLLGAAGLSGLLLVVALYVLRRLYAWPN
jgi:hypothetical protein